jgi:exodeoxyribonuclease VII small subunit
MSDENQNTTYADDIARIEEIIDKLRQNDCDIDKMLEYVTEASALLEKCQQKLDTTGAKIQKALMNLDTNAKSNP